MLKKKGKCIPVFPVVEIASHVPGYLDLQPFLFLFFSDSNGVTLTFLVIAETNSCPLGFFFILTHVNGNNGKIHCVLVKHVTNTNEYIFTYNFDPKN